MSDDHSEKKLEATRMFQIFSLTVRGLQDNTEQEHLQNDFFVIFGGDSVIKSKPYHII